jgi:hypothetical protein
MGSHLHSPQWYNHSRPGNNPKHHSKQKGMANTKTTKQPKGRGQHKTPKIIYQADAYSFHMGSLFLPLLLRDFIFRMSIQGQSSTFLIFP